MSWAARVNGAPGSNAPWRAVVAVGQHADANAASVDAGFARARRSARSERSPCEVTLPARAMAERRAQELEPGVAAMSRQRGDRCAARNRGGVQRGVLQSLGDELRAQARKVIAIGADRDVAVAGAQRRQLCA